MEPIQWGLLSDSVSEFIRNSLFCQSSVRLYSLMRNFSLKREQHLGPDQTNESLAHLGGGGVICGFFFLSLQERCYFRILEGLHTQRG